MLSAIPRRQSAEDERGSRNGAQQKSAGFRIILAVDGLGPPAIMDKWMTFSQRAECHVMQPA
jgi:hypothetical protein